MAMRINSKVADDKRQRIACQELGTTEYAAPQYLEVARLHRRTGTRINDHQQARRAFVEHLIRTGDVQ
jgi:hypothetical protein